MNNKMIKSKPPKNLITKQPNYIENKRKRTVIKNKRRNGLIKKAVQLSKMCDLQIYLAIYDEQFDRMVQFGSKSSFNCQNVQETIKRLKG